VSDCGSLLVWDSDNGLPLNYGDIAYWRSYIAIDKNREVSIPKLVEDNADNFRFEYLSLIYEFGEAKINGKRVVEYLKIRRKFSYWWMTLLVEKCNFSKSPQIDNVIKLIAFQEWLNTKNYSQVTLTTENADLANAMRQLTLERDISFEWQNVKHKTTNKSLAIRIFDRLNYVLQAFIWLIYHLISYWPLKGIGVEEWEKSKATTTFVSYLFNLVDDAAKKGRYESQYWTTLPELIAKNEIETNWLHIYVKNKQLPTASSAGEMIKQFNQSHKGSQVHVTLHSFLSIGLIVSVLRDWYSLRRLQSHLAKTIQKESGFLWPFFKNDFLLSLSGTVAIKNLLFLALFEKAMGGLKRQKKGFYLLENQGWEFGFIHAWRSASHSNELVGCPHSTIRYWDLRYFFDRRSFNGTADYNLPLPDFIAVNGKIAKKMYLDAGYDKDQLIEVEALRYLYLEDVVNYEINSSESVEEKIVLVLGDYLKKNTDKQMKLLQIADQFNDNQIRYLVKPHPSCPINVKEYPDITMQVTDEPISKLLRKCSVVYTSNITSAAIDAYYAGKNVITILDPQHLNLSPLRRLGAISFVSDSKDLANKLKSIGEINNFDINNRNVYDYFYLEQELSKWKKIIINK